MNPATQVPLTLSLSADVGDGVWLDLAWGGGLGQLPASLGALSSVRSPSLCTLGHVAPGCPTGLAGQERRKTALMGRALIYLGVTKYVKGR